jgi:L-gulonolactone oxidase
MAGWRRHQTRAGGPRTVSNWAGDQRCAPVAYDEPASEAEIAEAVGRAAAAGLPLRVVGSGHSFTDAACTDGHMLSLRRMDRVLDTDVDSGLVEVQAGIRLRELGVALAERGLAMENLGDVDAQSLAGALATGTHGTGARLRNLSAQVAALRLVTADGRTVSCSADEDPDLFRAARVGIGALGVVSAVTLRCIPLYTLRRVDEQLPLGGVLDRLQELADARERFEFFTFPYSGLALTRTTVTTDAPPAPPGRLAAWAQDVLLENAALGAFCRAGRAMPRLVPAIDRALGKLATGGVRVDRSHRIYANERLVHFTEMEYAIPRAAGADAVRAVLDLIERRRLPIVFPLEVRFAAADDAFLSSASQRDSCYVAVHQYRGMEFESYFRAVEAIMESLGGRPHWGKRHYRTDASLRPAYPDWDRFAAVRDRMDPERRFANDYTRRVLGP